MGRRVSFLLLAALAAVILVGMWAAPGRAGGATITVRDAAGQPITALTDGNRVQLDLRLAEPASRPLAVEFHLAPAGLPVATCTIARGQDSCQTGLFYSLGWYWDPGGQARPQRIVHALANGQALASSPVLQVQPRPVVMVHGFSSSADAWATYLGPDGYLAGIGIPGFAVGDGQVPGALDTGSISEPATRSRSIAENAATLGEYVTGVRQATGAEMVDLVAHSMGGLISRYYIDRVMNGREVAQLMMLGSPMAGTECANLPAAAGFVHPASLELRPAYIRGIFNQQITRRHGVPFYALAGTSVERPVASPCTGVPTDLVVSLESVSAIPLHLSEIELLHTDLNRSREAFEEFVRPRLQAAAGTIPEESDPPLEDSVPVEPLQFTRVFSGHVPAGGSEQITIQIESGVAVASFALLDTTRSLTVTVRGASGNVINLDTQTNGLVVVDDPSTLVFLGYGFENPQPGPWQVTLSSTSATPPEGAQFALTARLEGGVELDAVAEPLLVEPRQPVNVAAGLQFGGQPVAIQSAQAVIHGPDGSRQTRPVDIANGEGTANWSFDTPGLYSVDLVVSGQAPDGTPVERTAFLAVEVQPLATTPRAYAALAGVILVVCGAAAIVGLGAYWGGRRVLRGRATR